MIRQDPSSGPHFAGKSAPQIVELVFGATRVQPQRQRLPAALAIAGLAHLALVVWALGSRPSLEHWSAELAARVHTDLTHVEVVEIATPKTPSNAPEEPPEEPPEELPPPAEETSDDSPPTPTKASPTRPKEQVRQAPPAAAGRVLAADPNAPVDLSDNAFVGGQGSTYAGGVTSASGTGTQAGGHGDAKARPRPGQKSPKQTAKKKKSRRDDRSQSVQMRPGEWRCAWPSAAIGEPIHEQVVVLRVRVDAQGELIDARLLDDPGRGFGQAALACARAQRDLFTAARDPMGTAIRAWSPPIRVRFYR